MSGVTAMSYSQHHGVDASHYQVTVDMHAAAAAGIEFWYEKATEGFSTDPAFVSDDRQARMRSVFAVRGYYHFCHCDGIDAVLQGEHFATVVGALQTNEYVFVDIEAGWGSLTDAAGVNYLLDLIDAAQTAGGYTDAQTVIYGSVGWLRGQFGDDLSRLAARFHLAQAEYGVTEPSDPSPWSMALIWQYGEFGNVAGLGQGCVDTDVWLDGHWPIAESV
jgi:GH25 family lysozyme M1 (1,4-beta-N-acetylmuramidase)